MQSKAQLAIEQAAKDLPRPLPSGPMPLKSRKEGEVTRADDEVLALLREIRDGRQTGVGKWQDAIKLAITIILCVVTLAGAFALVVGDKRALELKMSMQENENLKLWQKIETQQLEIADINKRDAVRKALEEANRRK